MASSEPGVLTGGPFTSADDAVRKDETELDSTRQFYTLLG